MCLWTQRFCGFGIAGHETQRVPVVGYVYKYLSHVGGLFHANEVLGEVSNTLFQLFGSPAVDMRQYMLCSLVWCKIE
jgi:hypothetical protein